jgi:hypothetical protein
VSTDVEIKGKELTKENACRLMMPSIVMNEITLFLKAVVSNRIFKNANSSLDRKFTAKQEQKAHAIEG